MTPSTSSAEKPGTLLRIHAAEIKARYDMLLSSCERLDALRGTWLWSEEMAAEVEELQMGVADLGGMVSTLVTVARVADCLQHEMGQAS